MNFIHEPYKIPMESMSTNETCYYLFVSRRLVKLIIKKSNEGRWRFSYVNVEKIDFYGYEPVLMGFTGVIIFQKREE